MPRARPRIRDPLDDCAAARLDDHHALRAAGRDAFAVGRECNRRDGAACPCNGPRLCRGDVPNDEGLAHHGHPCPIGRDGCGAILAKHRIGVADRRHGDPFFPPPLSKIEPLQTDRVAVVVLVVNRRHMEQPCSIHAEHRSDERVFIVGQLDDVQRRVATARIDDAKHVAAHAGGDPIGSRRQTKSLDLGRLDLDANDGVEVTVQTPALDVERIEPVANHHDLVVRRPRQRPDHAVGRGDQSCRPTIGGGDLARPRPSEPRLVLATLRPQRCRLVVEDGDVARHARELFAQGVALAKRHLARQCGVREIEQRQGHIGDARLTRPTSRGEVRCIGRFLGAAGVADCVGRGRGHDRRRFGRATAERPAGDEPSCKRCAALHPSARSRSAICSTIVG